MNIHLKKYGNVIPSWTERFQSDRFLNPNEMICPLPVHVDQYGRQADLQSRTTNIAGCSSALERVRVEDEQRPKEFSNNFLNSMGVEGVFIDDDEDIELFTEDDRIIQPDFEIIKKKSRRREIQWIRLGQKDLYYKNLSGCL